MTRIFDRWVNVWRIQGGQGAAHNFRFVVNGEGCTVVWVNATTALNLKGGEWEYAELETHCVAQGWNVRIQEGMFYERTRGGEVLREPGRDIGSLVRGRGRGR